MKEKKRVIRGCVFMIGIFITLAIQGTETGAKPKPLDFNAYHPPGEVNRWLQDFAVSYPQRVRLHNIAVSPGGTPLILLELGPEIQRAKKNLPAIFVAANMEGTVPIATEAALYLAHLILDQPGTAKDITWYILPMGNPDASRNYFKKPLRLDNRNARPYNDDMDDQVDEDGVEDLDGNGIITRMRVKDPEGEWIPVPGEPRLMKKADWTKGETGIYKLYSEGIDNDRDGKYNEDGPGGVDIGINFPHLFKFYTKEGGAWAGSEAESYNLFGFIFRHPEIAMTICFGETNFCMVPPRGGRREMSDYSKIQIPQRIAKRFGYDPERTYSMKEIMAKARQMVPPDFVLTESMVAGFLGLGAAVNPLPEDLKFYETLAAEYKEFLKKNRADAKRTEPAPAKDGSFELWAYYHLGLPSFSLDFWTLPQPEEKEKEPLLTPEKLENMSSEEFLALGEEKIDAFLTASGAPDKIKAKMVMNMVKNGMMTTKKMAEMMRQMPRPKSEAGADPKEKNRLAFSDSQLAGSGFVNWKPFQHPTLGEVEIGGFVPFTDNTPPAPMLNDLLKNQVPWVFELVKKLPHMDIRQPEVKPLGSGLYRVTARVENHGYLPYPTAMGRRNQRIAPVVVSLAAGNYKLIEGKKRSVIPEIDGHSSQEIHWIFYAQKPLELTLELYTGPTRAGSKTMTLGGSK
jgi:hypothetical protein